MLNHRIRYKFSIQIYSKGSLILVNLSDVHFLYTSVGREDFDVYGNNLCIHTKLLCFLS